MVEQTGHIITICTVVVGFVGNALYFRGQFAERINNNKEDIENMKKSVQYKDTCLALTEGIKSRVASLETSRNGRK